MLSKVSTQTDGADARVVRGESDQRGPRIVAASVIHIDELAARCDCSDRCGEALMERPKAVVATVDRYHDTQLNHGLRLADDLATTGVAERVESTTMLETGSWSHA